MNSKQANEQYFQVMKVLDKLKEERKQEVKKYGELSKKAMTVRNYYGSIIKSGRKIYEEQLRHNNKAINIIKCSLPIQSSSISTRLPFTISQKEKKSALNLTNMKVQPEDIRLLFDQDMNRHIQHLYLCQNNIGTEGAALLLTSKPWEQLRDLQLEENSIKDFQIEPKYTRKLTRLYLGRNHLFRFPSNMTELECLEYLTIDNNQFRQIPDFLLEMRLRFLSISSNLIDNIEENQTFLRLKETLKFIRGVQQRSQ